MEQHQVIAVMDADCALCARGARWIARHDTKELFTIVPVQSALGDKLMRAEGLDPHVPLSWLIIDQEGAHQGLDAVMVAGRHLGGVWRALSVFHALPRPLRDRLYGLIARNRYRIFGRTDLCAMPDAAVQKRLYHPGRGHPLDVRFPPQC